MTGPFLGVFTPAEEIRCLLIYVWLWARASTHIGDRDWLWWDWRKQERWQKMGAELELEGRLRMQYVASGEQQSQPQFSSWAHRLPHGPILFPLTNKYLLSWNNTFLPPNENVSIPKCNDSFKIQAVHTKRKLKLPLEQVVPLSECTMWTGACLSFLSVLGWPLLLRLPSVAEHLYPCWSVSHQ